MRIDTPGAARALSAAASQIAQVAVFSTALLLLFCPSILESGSLMRGSVLHPSPQNQLTASPVAGVLRLPVADFGGVEPSAQARAFADWVASANDNKGTTFVVIDKKEARLYVFDGKARLSAMSAVLLGAAQGDETVPGIGDRPIALVQPNERTTPAGCFVAERGRNARGEDVVWVDYDAAVSMHRVVTSDATERRLERLASPSAEDNRISYCCINVPVAFYEAHIRPAFAHHSGIVYVLPDFATVHQVFGV